MMTTEPQTHPPFPETADIHTSTDEYADRFKGAVGAWMLDVQEKLTRRLLRDYSGASILDVGGGHGQLAVPLGRDGWTITVLGSDESCRHRLEPVLPSGHVKFEVGNTIELPHPDKSFDVAMSFRLLTHCGQWPQLIKELCRVARKGVIVDYPTSQSVNAIAPAFFGAKKKYEKNTRTWELFRHEQILSAFADNGFEPTLVCKQFFLPMVVHRMLKCKPLSAFLEGLCRGVGLTALWGSPVILLMTPKK